MKTIPLTRGFVALVDDCDYAYLITWSWSYQKARKGGYAVRTPMINGKRTTVLMHRVVAERAGMEIVGLDVDHRDLKDPLNGLNNQRSNLRPATRRDNQQHRKANANNKSGYKGVSSNGNNWRAQIVVSGKGISLGTYVDKKEAARAYNAAAIKHFGEFAYLNTI